MKKNLFVLLAVLLIASVTFSVALAGDDCNNKRFIPERVPRKCLQQEAQTKEVTTAASLDVNDGVGLFVIRGDREKRRRVNTLYFLLGVRHK